ncbi:ABC-type oligopeptide transport system substrate-binding subunit [Flavobacterium sp. CG_23.5]|uniref:hypothetical protein n=1 Tax=Flavobacterium sp. CG_23.5 TaxID=2760708 RepID=UPI001AEAB5D6|nr:hypothetical protein [Flavobacterium sp. CG_23.5]MBP2284807.1 ABC-type oligopeptide transport system substrate-binding subunit [Flavobacterium sp. CG_23.5]
MKKIFLFLAILMCYSISLVLQSCSTDAESTIDKIPNSFEKRTHKPNYSTKSSRTMPANNANPYDEAGRRLYKQKSYVVIQNLQKGSVISGVKSSDTPSLSSGKVSSILADSLSETIANWDATAEAKLSFSRFINSLLFLSKTEEQYEILYDFIVDYEASILTNETYSEKDKEVMLTNSSVVRFETYEESITPPKNKDPDWTILFREVSSSKRY